MTLARGGEGLGGTCPAPSHGAPGSPPASWRSGSPGVGWAQLLVGHLRIEESCHPEDHGAAGEAPGVELVVTLQKLSEPVQSS